MPVFVHGVATRRDPNYMRGVAARDALFRRYVHPVLGLDDRAEVFNAYWGDKAAKFRWNHASLPAGEVEEFGPSGLPEDVLVAEFTAGEVADEERVLTSVANRSLEEAVDLLWATAGLDADADEAKALATLAYRVTRLLPVLATDPNLTRGADDVAWLNALVDHVETALAAEPPPEAEAFGPAEVWDRLRESVIRVQCAAGRVAGRQASTLLRARALSGRAVPG